MRLEVKKNKKDKYIVKCPRLNKMVDSYDTCHHCEWLSIATAEYVRCRWTQEKEDLQKGRRYYETG